MIKIIVCDGDGTLGLPNPTDEIRDLIAYLPTVGIRLAVATNRPKHEVEDKFRRANLVVPSIIVTQYDVGEKKPSAKFIYEIQRRAEVGPHEMLFLGDDDRTDIFCAINARILPMAAQYSRASTSTKYGFPIEHPQILRYILDSFGKQSSFFGWRFDAMCNDTKRSIKVLSLIGQQSALPFKLDDFLKRNTGSVPTIGNAINAHALLYLYLVCQTYLSGEIMPNIDWITVYPGHKRASKNSILGSYIGHIGRLFRLKNEFHPELIERHSDAPKSQYQHDNRDIFDQFRTIQINPDYKKSIQGKSILVLDDFTTYGFSLETARRMLLQAGAKEVIGMAIAKFRRAQAVTHISKSWDPFTPCTLTKGDILTSSPDGVVNLKADEYLKNNIVGYFQKI